MIHTDVIDKFLFRYGFMLKRLKNLDDQDIYASLYDKDALAYHCFYNVGAGIFNHPLWTNIDHYSKWYKQNTIHVDIDLQKCENWDIPSSSACIVYCSHTIEHLSNPAVKILFHESFRILRPGGYFRVTTPDADLFWESFMRNDKSLWRYLGMDTTESVRELLVRYFASQLTLDKQLMKQLLSSPQFGTNMKETMDHIISFCKPEKQEEQPEGHMNWWSAEKIMDLMYESGFKEVDVSSYGKSKCPVLRNVTYFDSTHPQISVYVEARK